MYSGNLRTAITSFKSGLIYKATNVCSIINRIIEISVFVFIWQAMYRDNPASIGEMTLNQMMLYYIISVTMSHIINWGVNEEIGESIREGRVTMELLYPIGYMRYYFFYKLGGVARQIIIIIIPSFILSILLFRVSIQEINIMNILMFCVVTGLAVVIIYIIEFMVGIFAFKTDSTWGLQVLKQAIITVFSGSLAPIEFYPQILQNIVNVLPFKDLIYSPTMILIGMQSTNDIVMTVIRQLIWIAVLFCAATIMYKILIKKVTVYGG